MSGSAARAAGCAVIGVDDVEARSRRRAFRITTGSLILRLGKLGLHRKIETEGRPAVVGMLFAYLFRLPKQMAADIRCMS